MIIIITIIIMHLAGSPGSYFAYLKDCLEEWGRNKKLECTLSMAEKKAGWFFISFCDENKDMLWKVTKIAFWLRRYGSLRRLKAASQNFHPLL